MTAHLGGVASPARRLRRYLFSCQRSEARQTARWRRAAGARSRRKSIWSATGVFAATVHSAEARDPKSIIQERKKGFRNLVIVFMEIRVVTAFSGKILTRRNGEFPGIIAGIK
jgi:hypothetical protein